MSAVPTRRWYPVVAIGLLSAGLGAVLARPEPFYVAAVAVVYAAGGLLLGPPPIELTLERTVAPTDPAPGDAVSVTVTVTNRGGRAIPDLRVVDGVPRALEVVAGSARRATALPADGEVSFDYELRAARGVHGFDPASVVTRGWGGGAERSTRVSAATETVIECLPLVSGVPLRSRTSVYAGRIATDVGGSGQEFHATRGYRPGDPIRRIDWNRYAATTALSTLEFREERAAIIVAVLDARPAAYWAADPGERHAVDHGVAAAGMALGTLLDGGHRVGLASLGHEPDPPSDARTASTAGPDHERESVWVDPGAGSAFRARLRHVLATHPGLGHEPPAEPPELAIDPEHDPIDLGPLLARLPVDAQVLLVTPLCDDAVADAAHRLDAAGHPVTVVSPDVTGRRTPGTTLASLQRDNRVRRLRRAGLRVIDWDPDVPFRTALAPAGRRR